MLDVIAVVFIIVITLSFRCGVVFVALPLLMISVTLIAIIVFAIFRCRRLSL